MKNTSLFALTALMSALLSACGGDSSSSSSDPAPETTKTETETTTPEPETTTDVIDRTYAFAASIDKQYNSRSIGYLSGFGDFNTSENIKEKGETLSALQIEEKRISADEIDSDHFCDIDSVELSTRCWYLAKDDMVRVTKYVKDSTNTDIRTVEIRQDNGGMTDFSLATSSGNDALFLFAMVPSTTGDLGEFSEELSIVGDWSITSVKTDLHDPAPEVTEGAMRCTEDACSGAFNITGVLYVKEDGKKEAWVGKADIGQTRDATVIGTVSKDNSILSFHYSVGNTIHVISGVRQ